MARLSENDVLKGGTAAPGAKAAAGNARLVQAVQAALMGRGKEVPLLPVGMPALKGAAAPRLPEGHMIAPDGTPVLKAPPKSAGQGATGGAPVQAVIDRRIEQGGLRAAFQNDIKAAQLDRRTARDALRTYDQLMQGGPANKRMAVQLQGAAVQAAALKAKIDADRNVTKTEALIRLKPLYAAMQRAGQAGDQAAFQKAKEQYTQAYALEQAKQQALSVKARSGMDAADDGVRNTIAGAQAYFGAGSAYGGMPGQAGGGQYGGVNGTGDGARERFGARAGSAYSGILDQTGVKSTPIPVRPEGIIDGLQTALDIAGLIPILGEAADGLNALISLARGNYADAALSAAAMLPIIGWLSTAGKGAKRALKGADAIGTIASYGDEAVEAGEAILKPRVIEEVAEGAGRVTDELVEGAGELTKGAGKVANEFAEGTGSSLRISDKQFGKKVGKHAGDFGLDPSNSASRDFIKDKANEIFREPNEIREGIFRGQGNVLPNGSNATGKVKFYIHGRDVVVTDINNNFITIMKDGIDNFYVKQATQIWS